MILYASVVKICTISYRTWYHSSFLIYLQFFLQKLRRITFRTQCHFFGRAGRKHLTSSPSAFGSHINDIKSLLAGPLEAAGKKGVIAFIWLDNELHASSEVEEKVKKLLQLTAERMV